MHTVDPLQACLLQSVTYTWICGILRHYRASLEPTFICSIESELALPHVIGAPVKVVAEDSTLIHLVYIRLGPVVATQDEELILIVGSGCGESTLCLSRRRGRW